VPQAVWRHLPPAWRNCKTTQIIPNAHAEITAAAIVVAQSAQSPIIGRNNPFSCTLVLPGCLARLCEPRAYGLNCFFEILLSFLRLGHAITFRVCLVHLPITLKWALHGEMSMPQPQIANLFALFRSFVLLGASVAGLIPSISSGSIHGAHDDEFPSDGSITEALYPTELNFRVKVIVRDAV
jgi:hypothetical protein